MSGTIRERGPGRWQIQVYAGGRRYARTIHGTRAQAKRALPEFIVEVRRRAGATLGHDATVGDLLDRWLDARASRWKPSTDRENRRKIDTLIRPTLGELRLTDLRAHHLDALYARLLEHGLSAQTVHHAHGLIRAALNQAVRWDLIAKSPAAAASPPSPRRATYVTPTPGEVAMVIDLLTADPQFAAFVRLAAVTGARRGSLVALRWTDLDLDAGLVTFARAISVGAQGPVELGTKTDRVYRVSVDDGTVADLRRLRARQAANALACGVSLPADSYVFAAGPDGAAPWHPDRATYRWRQVRARAGLDRVRLHDLRHAVATQLLAAGVDLAVVADRLGHDPSTTLKIYAHALPERDRAAADYLGALLDGDAGTGS